MAQDSSRPEFWDTRYRGGVTPWDAAGVPPRLAAWLAAQTPPLRVLVPGCGTGYEVRAFHEHGHDVLAIDFSDAALEAARRQLGTLKFLTEKADFFELKTEPFDLIYERALLCALPRREWPRWAARMGELLRPGGRLAGFFYIDDNERGPPFGTDLAGLHELLDPGFLIEEDLAQPPEHSLAVFAGKERWQVWKRKL